MTQPAVIPSLAELKPVLLQVKRRFASLFPARLPSVRSNIVKLARNPGKFIRPALLLRCARLFNPRAWEDNTVLDLAGLVESLHLASLLHDDVVDNADRRRGKVAFNIELHNKFSVILADYLMSRAFQLLSQLEDIRFYRILASTAADMALGQLEEMQHQGDVQLTQAQYLGIIRNKTASLFSAACALGAIAGGASEPMVRALGEFGSNLGMAFQITDDALDLWGDAVLLGKPTGGDLREGKITLPIIILLSRTSPRETTRLKAALQDKSGELSREVLALLASHRCREAVERYSSDYVGKAQQGLRGIPETQPLNALADYVLSRDR